MVDTYYINLTFDFSIGSFKHLDCLPWMMGWIGDLFCFVWDRTTNEFEYASNHHAVTTKNWCCHWIEFSSAPFSVTGPARNGRRYDLQDEFLHPTKDLRHNINDIGNTFEIGEPQESILGVSVCDYMWCQFWCSQNPTKNGSWSPEAFALAGWKIRHLEKIYLLDLVIVHDLPKFGMITGKQL